MRKRTMMDSLRLQIATGMLLFAAALAAPAQAQLGTDSNTVRVTPDNFNRAETDTVFAGGVKLQGLGRFSHHREPTPLDFHIVRPNRDTLYSLSVFDLDAGPVTVTLPDPGGRFLTMQVIDEDHYTPEVVYGAGTHTFTRDQVGTRYV